MSRPAQAHDDNCSDHIRNRLALAGPNGLTTTGLELPSAGSSKGKACREALKRLLKNGEIGNLGTPGKPRYVAAEHFRPLELAYDHVSTQARDAGIRLSSKRSMSKGLRGAVLRKVDEALKLLVAEGVLLRLKWAGNPLYLHAAALPSQPASDVTHAVDRASIRRAYDETVREFGYPDVLIHELHLRLGGELEPLKHALMEACRAGDAIPGTGDWSLSSDQERAAALYINGHPHLRIRLKP